MSTALTRFCVFYRGSRSEVFRLIARGVCEATAVRSTLKRYKLLSFEESEIHDQELFRIQMTGRTAETFGTLKVDENHLTREEVLTLMRGIEFVAGVRRHILPKVRGFCGPRRGKRRQETIKFAGITVSLTCLYAPASRS